MSIIKYWYGDNNGKWSELFVLQVRSIRNQFKTVKVSTGVESSDKWIPYNLQGRDQQVCVVRFQWATGNYPDFFLDTLIRDARSASPFWQHRIRIQFPSNYPAQKPSASVPDFSGRADNPHAHHIMGDGGLCNFADSSDWNSQRDTALSFFNATLNLLVWHYYSFGW